MSDTLAFAPGGFRYIKAVFQYSAGVAAEPGFEIERARLLRPLPLAEGFDAVERHLQAIGRPTHAFCACELRSPAPFTEQDFIDFNRQYVQTLERWGLYSDGANPVARTNVCPEYDKPAGPSLYAFAIPCRPAPPAQASSSPAAGKRRRANPTTATTSCGSATPAAKACAKRFAT